MAKTRITKATIDDAMKFAKLLGQPRVLYDTELTGFMFRAAKSGGGSYSVEYRLVTRSQYPQRFVIGKASILSPDEARREAKKLLGRVAAGEDPQAAKQLGRDKAAGLTFGALAALYFDYREDETRRKGSGSNYWNDARGVFRREIPGPLANRAAALVTRADLRRALDTARERAASAEQWLYDILPGVFRWGIEREHLSTSPADGLTPPPARKRRERVLSPDELRALLRALDGLSYPWGPMVRLLVFTGSRLNEVARMAWKEADLAGALWTLPAERSKNGREHALELSQEAVALLGALPKRPGGYVFTTSGRTPVSGFSKMKRRLDAALGPDFPPWRLHDLRRTFATLMADELGVDEKLIDHLLNHWTGRGGVAGIYQRAKYLAKRREAVNLWGAYLRGLYEKRME